MDDRISSAEARAQQAQMRAREAEAKVNVLRREAAKTERKKRARALIQMGAELHALGLRDASDVGRFLSILRGVSVRDAQTGERVQLLQRVVDKATEPRITQPPV